MCPPLVLIGDKDANSWPLFSLPHVTMTVLVYSKDYSFNLFLHGTEVASGGCTESLRKWCCYRLL